MLGVISRLLGVEPGETIEFMRAIATWFLAIGKWLGIAAVVFLMIGIVLTIIVNSFNKNNFKKVSSKYTKKRYFFT